MRVSVALLALLCCVACTAPAPPLRWYEATPTPVEPRLRWQWALEQTPDTAAADVFVLDAFTTDAATVDDLHRARRRAVCYLELGVIDPRRPDAGRFPRNLTGPPEKAGPRRSPQRNTIRWTDPQRITPILTDRLRMCRDKGFDGAALDRLASAPDAVIDGLLTHAHQLRLPVGLLDSARPGALLSVPAPAGPPIVAGTDSGGRKRTSGS